MNSACECFTKLGNGVTHRARFGLKSPPGMLARGLATLALLTLVTLPVRAQYEFRAEPNPDGTITVGGRGPGPGCPSGAVTIPDSIGGRRVTRLDFNAFSGCSGLTGITLPETLTSIGGNAFSQCSGLTRITIPDGVAAIEDHAFQDCVNLTNVILGDGVTRIGGFVFDGCPIPEPVLNRSRTTLAWVPRGTTGTYRIPESVTAIADSAFQDCMLLTNVVIPDTVTTIGDQAFANCFRLPGITLPERATTIGSLAFASCPLTNVTLPDRVTHLGRAAFQACSQLTNVHIGSGLTNLSGQLFWGCAGLSSVTVPATISRIETGAFGDCANLRAVYFLGNAPSVDGPLFRSFDQQLSPTSIYHLPGALGWADSFAERPALPWTRSRPTILALGGLFGLSTNGFGFVISWATNVPVVVEANAGVANAVWTPISTNLLTAGWVRFTDREWRSEPARFYRVRPD